jgi:hypothetical protein
MKRLINIVILFFALLGLITCDTDSNTPPDFRNYFVKYYGANGNQQGVDIVVNDDGTMLLLGNSQEFENDSHFFVVKIDSTGHILWENDYGENEIAVDIEPTFDGNYVIATQKTLSASDTDVRLLKISPEGDSLISVVHGFTNRQELIRSVTPLLDGSYLMTGGTDSVRVGLGNEIKGFLFKCNNNFVFDRVLWDVTYGKGLVTEGIKFFERSSGYYLFLTSNAREKGGEDFNFSFASIGFDSEVLDEAYFADSDSDVGNEKFSRAALIKSTNGFALVGTSESDLSKTVYTVITGSTITSANSNVSNSGNEKLNISSNFLENYSGKSICPSMFGGFFVLADKEITIGNSLTKTMVLVRLDAQGRVLWSRNFGSEFSTSGTALAELPNGKLIIIGTATLDNQEKMALIKTNVEGRFLN